MSLVDLPIEILEEIYYQVERKDQARLLRLNKAIYNILIYIAYQEIVIQNRIDIFKINKLKHPHFIKRLFLVNIHSHISLVHKFLEDWINSGLPTNIALYFSGNMNYDKELISLIGKFQVKKIAFCVPNSISEYDIDFLNLYKRSLGKLDELYLNSDLSSIYIFTTKLCPLKLKSLKIKLPISAFGLHLPEIILFNQLVHLKIECPILSHETLEAIIQTKSANLKQLYLFAYGKMSSNIRFTFTISAHNFPKLERLTLQVEDYEFRYTNIFYNLRNLRLLSCSNEFQWNYSLFPNLIEFVAIAKRGSFSTFPMENTIKLKMICTDFVLRGLKKITISHFNLDEYFFKFLNENCIKLDQIILKHSGINKEHFTNNFKRAKDLLVLKVLT